MTSPPLSTVPHLRVAEPAGEPPAAPALPVRAIIADGHRLVRAGLRRLFDDQRDIVVVGEAADADELLALMPSLYPDVVVVDVELPGIDGFDVTRRIMAQSPSGTAGVVLLVGTDSDEHLFAALEAGAAGVLAKDIDPPELLRAVRVVADGGALVGPELTHRLIARALAQGTTPRDVPAALTELTAREREVMALVAAGLTNAEISERLVITPATAKTHVSRARRKLGARDRAQLVVYAYRSGLVTVPPPDDALPRYTGRLTQAWPPAAAHGEARAA
jgi:DNA-binding NarL/FixJ family response regulator